MKKTFGRIEKRINNFRAVQELPSVFEGNIFKRSYSAYCLAHMVNFLIHFNVNAYREFRAFVRYPFIDFGVFRYSIKRNILLGPVVRKYDAYY